MENLPDKVKFEHFEHIDPAAVAAAESAKARIQSAYVMALKKPRNEDESRDRILHACKRPAFADKVEFSKPVAGRQIKGPSIRFAELALRAWGNVLSDVQVLYEDDAVRRSRVMVVDLETNTSFSKEIQITKTVERRKADDREIVGERVNTSGERVYIVKATDEELHNKEAASISKALRNEGLRIIPTDIVDEAIETARKTLSAEDAKDPDAAKKRILDAFSEIGVKPKEIEKYLGHKTDTLNPKELEDLRAIYRAIKDGEATWRDYEKSHDKKSDVPDVAVIDPKILKKFNASIPKEADKSMIEKYLKICADYFKKSIDEIQIEAMKDIKSFWRTFERWSEDQKKKSVIQEKEEKIDEMAPGDCPEAPGKTFKASYCNECNKRQGCPVWN
jgi:hypothetical protein